MKNNTLLTDLYQLTMIQGYFKRNRAENVIFDLFYRSNPSGNGYAIANGLSFVVDYIKNLNFTEDMIQYLREQNLFEEDFLEYLKDFKFTGNIHAVPEGTVVFPMEPLLKVEAPIIEAQFIETALLTYVNHGSLIATKAARVCTAAEGDAVLEFGLRRAQGPDAGTLGARAAVIGGCVGTSNVQCGKEYQVPISGTHAHSWIMSFDTELEAFEAYADTFPDSVTLLVDTYNTLKSGVPNAIKVFKALKDAGKMPKKAGIRLDSGDLAYLSKEARKMMDKADLKEVKIVASSDLDEHLIMDLKAQGAKIDIWGVGTNLITSKDCPAFGGVYKLSAIEKDGEYIPKIKLSNNSIKITNPGNKNVYRILDKETGKIKADIIGFEHETINSLNNLTIFHPVDTWKRTTFEKNTFEVRKLLIPIFIDGECVYDVPSTMEAKAYCKEELNTLWDESKRLINPDIVYVDLSKKLYDLKMKLLEENS